MEQLVIINASIYPIFKYIELHLWLVTEIHVDKNKI